MDFWTFMVLTGLHSQVGSPVTRSLTVCELLADPQRYSGSIIHVAGAVASPPFGIIVIGEDCENHIVASNHQFADVVAIMPSDIHPLLTAFPVSFDGLAEFKALGRKIDEGMNIRSQLVCELKGLFEARRADRLWSSFARTPRGFGHLNAAPVQLILQSVVTCRTRKEKVAVPELQPRQLPR